MIATFWNVLFKYVDKLKVSKETYENYDKCNNCKKATEKCHMTCLRYKKHMANVIKLKRVRTAREIESLLQTAYDDGLEYRTELTNYHPETDLDKAVCSIRGLQIFRYKGIHYEIDGRHLDTPKEVFEHLKEIREGEITGLANDEKRRVLEDVAALIRKCEYAIQEMSVTNSIEREEYDEDKRKTRASGETRADIEENQTYNPLGDL